MDGTVLGDADTDSFEVTMADRARWEYVLTDEQEQQPDGSLATVYICRGRV